MSAQTGAAKATAAVNALGLREPVRMLRCWALVKARGLNSGASKAGLAVQNCGHYARVGFKTCAQHMDREYDTPAPRGEAS